MQTFQLSTGQGQAPGQRNFVFVNEHNRHKRLKVMRACEGCRRRKIKCDAATTNTWPCGACRRLRHPCVPPAGGADGEQSTDEAEVSSSQDAHNIAPQQYQPPYEDYQTSFQPNDILSQNMASSTQYEISPPHPIYTDQDFTYMQQISQPHIPNLSMTTEFHYGDSSDSQRQGSSPKTPEQQTAEILMDRFGELKISENGVAPWIRQQTDVNREEPAVPIQETEINLPPSTATAGSQIRIPPELMPSDEDAVGLFEIFFTHVHPYVPVICRESFYYQWNHCRHAISPLLLEAIFACAARMSGEPVGDSSWLALANKHEQSFLDTPRLSTVQALLLLLKAREGSPKRGYFYKSWMTCRTIVSMAKDLDMHEHLATHAAGESCGFIATECLAKTRIWQTLLVCETMIAGSQGRSDLGIDPDSVEYGTSPPNSNVDDYEAMITRQYAFYVQNARNIRLYFGAYIKLKKKKDWALDPLFVSHNEDFRKWLIELPEDLQITIPNNGTPPQIASHFIGNLHCHHQLGIIMMHRPQLLALKATPDEHYWRQHFSICYTAAKKLCLIQEAIVAQHGVLGLLCMQRGMSFTIYATLTCIMLHMVAITSPDDDFGSNSREYFVRHMRLLEKCVPEWPMPETVQQIDNLREAFSADLDQPFELKQNFPYGSPEGYSPSTRRPSEPPSVYGGSSGQGYTPQHWQQDNSHFTSPPMSIDIDSSNPHTPAMYQDYAAGQSQPIYHQTAPANFTSNEVPPNQQWNPSPIIDHFSTAFAIPPSALAPPQGGPYLHSPSIQVSQNISTQAFSPSPQTPIYDQSMYSHAVQAQTQTQMPMHRPHPSHTVSAPAQYFDSSLHSGQQQVQQGLAHSPYSPPSDTMGSSQRSNSTSGSTQIQNQSMMFITPKQWQQSVARVYDPTGLKRKWHYDMQGEVSQR